LQVLYKCVEYQVIIKAVLPKSFFGSYIFYLDVKNTFISKKRVNTIAGRERLNSNQKVSPTGGDLEGALPSFLFHISQSKNIYLSLIFRAAIKANTRVFP
jgi:hypothetical protein